MSRKETHIGSSLCISLMTQNFIKFCQERYSNPVDLYPDPNEQKPKFYNEKRIKIKYYYIFFEFRSFSLEVLYHINFSTSTEIV